MRVTVKKLNNYNNMGAEYDCCQPSNTQEELNEIFAGVPDDNQLPELYNPIQLKQRKVPTNSIGDYGFEYESAIPGNFDPRPTIIRDVSNPPPLKKTVNISMKQRAVPYEDDFKQNDFYPPDERNSNSNRYGNYNFNNNFMYNNNNLNDNNYNNNNYNRNTASTREIPRDEDVELPPMDDAEQILNEFDNHFGPCRTTDDFNPDGWKELYPEGASFFIWNKDNIQTLPDQTKIFNSRDNNDQEVYKGEINPDNGMRHGFGENFSRYGSQKGTWRNDQFTGWGRETKRGEAGEYVETKFLQGNKGNRQIIHSDQKRETYKGETRNDVKEGKGILDNPKIHYEGGFANNMYNGNGKIQIKSNDGGSYEGSFKNGSIEGYGTFTYKNGDVYQGQFRQGIKHGKGQYKYANGDIYDGEYVDGKKHGHGRMINHDGKIWEGEFVNGKRQKK